LLDWFAGKPVKMAGFPANSAMKPATSDSVPQPWFLLPDLATMLDARQPLYRLALTMDWTQFETAFAKRYKDEGRPALPIRRMVGLLLLKQLHNLSDERVVEQWTLNPYFQFFCGECEFQWSAPCAASELVHFRDRIGPDGGEKLLATSIALHGARA
jgi:transposase, IS5 family